MAWVITVILLIALIVYVNDEAVTQRLHDWFRFAVGSVIVWFIFGPVWSLVFFRRETT